MNQNEIDAVQRFQKLKCSYKEFHICFGKFSDYCAYCGWNPVIVKDDKKRQELNKQV